MRTLESEVRSSVAFQVSKLAALLSKALRMAAGERERGRERELTHLSKLLLLIGNLGMAHLFISLLSPFPKGQSAWEGLVTGEAVGVLHEVH